MVLRVGLGSLRRGEEGSLRRRGIVHVHCASVRAAARGKKGKTRNLGPDDRRLEDAAESELAYLLPAGGQAAHSSAISSAWAASVASRRALALRAAHVSSACCASVATRAAALPAALPAALAPSWPPWPSRPPARYGASSAACVSKPE